MPEIQSEPRTAGRENAEWVATNSDSKRNWINMESDHTEKMWKICAEWILSLKLNKIGILKLF